MKIVRTVAEIRGALSEGQSLGRDSPSGGTVPVTGLVPTMGSFHAGHVSLLAAARAECDIVVASLFVNPAQFGPAEDLSRYPRDEERDARAAEEAGVDFLFAPSSEEMYPPDYETWVDVGELGRRLEGQFRPGHFRGVATVCLKLFNIVRPQRAYFGQKDAQQAAVVKRLVADLNLDVEIRVLPTIRDEDGLALSTRNAYLSSEEREAALALPRALATKDPTKARELLAALDVDYVELAELDGQKVLAAAVHVGQTRLIDNVVLDLPCQDSSWLGRAKKGENE
jgi:pantoate--beta-alanine ligase